MDTIKQRLRVHMPFLLYMILYFVVNALVLTRFPYMHSDEPWLGALSRSMLIQGDYSVTEPFFDVYSRNPHAIRVLFHLLQSGVIQVFGFGLFQLRMISLVFGAGSLFMMYDIGLSLWKSKVKALVVTALLSLNVWFIYASHFARQEIILVFVILSALAFLLRNLESSAKRRDVVLGILLGLGIGIHPNSFIMALAMGAVYVYLIRKRILRWKNLAILIATVGIFALSFVLISLMMDPNYFQNYIQNGHKFGVDRGLLDKILAAGSFFSGIWNREGLTYYIPNLRIPLVLFGICLVVSLFQSWQNRRGSDWNANSLLLMGSGGILAGLILIGRYNPTSMVFFFPFLYLLLGDMKMGRWKNAIRAAVLCVLLGNMWFNVPNYASSYPAYESQIAQWVSPQDKTLANLNLGFYFDEGKLLDYRNLRYFQEAGLTFDEYVSTRNIRYIIYSEELRLINEKKPAYNKVYGNPDFYYEELIEFLENDCELIGAFENPTYGVHVANWVDQNSWKISVFKVRETP